MIDLSSYGVVSPGAASSGAGSPGVRSSGAGLGDDYYKRSYGMSRTELFGAYLDALVATGAITQATADEAKRQHPDGDASQGTLSIESVEFLRDSLAANYMTVILEDGTEANLGEMLRDGDGPVDADDGDDGPVTYHVQKSGVGAAPAESDRIV
jgi:hypothetical protein